MKKIFLAIVLLSVPLFMGASCYGSNSSNSNPVSTNQVSISNMAFSPPAISVSKGATVTWTNNDSVAHTVTSDNGKFNSSQLSNGGKFQFTFSESGTFSYHCSIHPSMTGKVIVN